MAIPIPTYRCPRAAGTPTIDGRWDKPFWAEVPATRPFVNYDNTPASQETRAKLCWDEAGLYVAYFCVDDDIWGTYRQRDEPIYNEDVVEIFLDPAGAGRRYFEIEVSPHGVEFDCTNVNTGDSAATVDYDPTWDCAGLRTAVQVRGTLDDLSVRDEWWSVELAIPWTGLELDSPPAVGDTWRVNLYRIDRDRRGEFGRDEFQAWSPLLTAEPDYNVPSRFGVLEFGE